MIHQRTVKNKPEAQALAQFLWNELQRHIDDCCNISNDLTLLKNKWKVRPRIDKREFVKP